MHRGYAYPHYRKCCLLFSAGSETGRSWRGYFWTPAEFKSVADRLVEAGVNLNTTGLTSCWLDKAGFSTIGFAELVHAVREVHSNPALLANIPEALQEVSGEECG